MKFIFFLSQTLPVKTGPSFVPFDRIKHCSKKGKVDVYCPWPRIESFKSFAHYTDYINVQYGLLEYKNINILPLLSSYSHVLNWYSAESQAFENILNKLLNRDEKTYIIFEDPGCHYFMTYNCFNMNNFLKKLSNEQNIHIFAIHHTNYANIVPTWFYHVVCFWMFNFVYYYTASKNFKHVHLMPYNRYDTLFNNNHLIKPELHSINKTFFNISHRNLLPCANSVYFIGKIDYDHKNLSKILEWTTEITNIYVYGVGRHEHFLKKDMIRFKDKIIHTKSISHEQMFTNSIFRGHKIYVSLSEKEGVCTATGEALAMNKFAIVANHESNNHFKSANNCFPVELNKSEYQQLLKKLLNMPPQKEMHVDKFLPKQSLKVFDEILESNHGMK